MKLIEDMDAKLDEGDEKGLALLREIDFFRGPGWVRKTGEPLDPYGDVSSRLLDLGLIIASVEPMGTWTDGREDYGTVYKVTTDGIEELACWE